MVRLFRAISGKRQRPFAKAANIHPSMLAKYETDEVEAPAEVLPPMADQAGLSVADGEELLRHCELLRLRRKRAGSGARDILVETTERLGTLLTDTYELLLRLPPEEDETDPS